MERAPATSTISVSVKTALLEKRGERRKERRVTTAGPHGQPRASGESCKKKRGRRSRKKSSENKPFEASLVAENA